MPNDPPTLPVRTRSFSTGTPRMPLSGLRCPNTPWQPRRRISRSVSGSYSLMAERGSIGHTTIRLLRSDRVVTYAARAKAAATCSLSP